jgi:integrase
MATEGIKKHVAKNGTVSWRVRVELPPDPVTGKRRAGMKTFRTRDEATAARAGWLTEIERGVVVAPHKVTVGEQLRYWLESYARHTVGDKTLYDYENMIRSHILSHSIAAVPLQKLTPQHVEAFKSAKAAAGTGARTQEMCYMRISQMLDHAVKLDLIPRNVAKQVQPPRVPKREMQTWNAEQARRFLAVAAECSYGPLWLVYRGTGMRRGEALGLRWKDVDFERGTLSVCQTVGMVRGTPKTKPMPKNDSSRRTIAVDTAVMEALREHRGRQEEHKRAARAWTKNELVFPSAVGTPINPNNLARGYLQLVAKAGVPRIRIHDTRHTHVTLAGAQLGAVSKRVGHARTSTTADLYAHVLPEMHAEVATRINTVLFSAPLSQPPMEPR